MPSEIQHHSFFPFGSSDAAERPGLHESSTGFETDSGSVTMKQWSFDGFRIGYSDMQLSAPFSADWKQENGFLTLFFNLSGKIRISDSSSAELNFSRLEHSLFYRAAAEGKMEYDGSACRHFIIQLSPQAFARLHREAPQTLSLFGDAISSKQPMNFENGNGEIDPVMHAVLNDLLLPPVEGESRKLYLTAKCLELIALQAESFRKKSTRQLRFCKTSYDYERLVFARDYLLQHYDVPPGLQELSRMAGINEFKLKNGFREIFGDTVFGYLTKYKMEMARTYIAEAKLSLAEIAFDLGYSSPQHFSKAFRKHFGYPPSEMKAQRKVPTVPMR